MNKRTQEESERAALVQRSQLDGLHRHHGELEEHAAALEHDEAKQSDKVSRLDTRMDSLFVEAGLKRPEAEQIASVEVADHIQPSVADEAAILERLPDLSLGLLVPDTPDDWNDYLREVELYVVEHGIDLNRDPLDQLLPPNRAVEICRQFEKDFGTSPWDRWDYGVITLAVFTGALLDYFLVVTSAKPGKYFKGEPQRGSPVTDWMREQSKRLAPIKGSDGLERNLFQQWIAEGTTAAEKWAKVPYDLVNPSRDLTNPKHGLTPNVHRLGSLGHSPDLLGLVFGIKDIVCRTCTFVDPSGAWRVVKFGSEMQPDLLQALVKVIVHGFSDVFTEKGLPAPFLSVLQLVNVNSGFTLKEGGPSVSVTNLVRYMYSNGYDLRHFMTMAIAPSIAELIIRTYHTLRTCRNEADLGKAGIRGKFKLSKMLALTHGLLASSNIVKIALYNWNPTAFNIAQFGALAKQMLSLLKLAGERDNLIQQQLTDGWKELLAENFKY